MANENNNLPRETGVPTSFGAYATVRATDISASTELIAGKTDHAIVITDIVVNKATDGTFSLLDASVEFLTIYLKSASNGNANYQNHFVNPLKLTGGSALNVQLDSVETDYSALVTYYYQKG